MKRLYVHCVKPKGLHMFSKNFSFELKKDVLEVVGDDGRFHSIPKNKIERIVGK